MIDEAEKAAAPKAKAKAGKAKAKAQPGPALDRVLPEGELTQAMLRSLLPDGGSLWKGKAGNFQSHFPPFKRASATWQLWGHRGAAVRVLRDCWENALLAQGKSTDQCPIKGLFTQDGVAALP